MPDTDASKLMKLIHKYDLTFEILRSLISQGRIGLDFETYCDLNITEVGLDNYMAHPSFKILIAGLASQYSATSERIYIAIDFVMDPDAKKDLLYFLEILGSRRIFAHNAMFEYMCLLHLGVPEERLLGLKDTLPLVDTAVVARMDGAGSSLFNAARQLAEEQKLPEGADLIKQFSMPSRMNDWQAPTRELLEAEDQLLYTSHWQSFKHYCVLDAYLSYVLGSISATADMGTPINEIANQQITGSMNRQGWHVDLESVKLMQERYERNLGDLLIQFYIDTEQFDVATRLNLNSPMQLKRWCEARGIRATSFNVAAVEKLDFKLRKKLSTMMPSDPKFKDYQQVLRLLETKQELGGTALKKLQVIRNLVSEDGQLRDQYIHAGAGQTLRTTGRGVQMQNLKRLNPSTMIDMEDLANPNIEFSNTVLGENLRQVFTSRHPQGKLIVGDFSSIESRVLAWLAGADWKVNAFATGRDMYKVAAEKIFAVPYDGVTKQQRQVGKVAELSCGYGGGPAAVQRFAEIYGVDMPEQEAIQLVRDQRAANPEIVKLWESIDVALHNVMAHHITQVNLACGLNLVFEQIPTPFSLAEMMPNAKSISMRLTTGDGLITILRRVFHGCYTSGRNIRVFKPSEGKSGPAWVDSFLDPVTKQRRFYDIYGGKLTGILTQSVAREMFFSSLRRLHVSESQSFTVNWSVIGQFHDEIVIDWWPHSDPAQGETLENVVRILRRAMTTPDSFYKGFPLEAEINCDYRYIK